jgi:hypothetical protein
MILNRYNLKGNKRLEKFADLPGQADNLRFTNRNTILVPFAEVENSPFGYSMVAEYDLNGKPLRSWHDPTGKLIALGSSQMTLYKNKLYLGSFSPSVDYIAMIDYN